MNPTARKFWQSSGGWALGVLAALTLATVFAEGWVGSRALCVSYAGRLYFPLFSATISGRDLGADYDYEANYRQLAAAWRAAPQAGRWVVLPAVPFGPNENALAESPTPRWGPTPPDAVNPLGTDTLGRDILSRLVYGYRNALIFSAAYIVGLFVLGTAIGLIMGYCGGAVDFWGQRFIEIWSNIPFIYVVMIVASIVTPSLMWLVAITLIFSWPGLASYVRTLAFREKTHDFVQAARIAGAGGPRILATHILPQMTPLLLTFLPFQAAGAITTLTSLDFLGFGLRPPAASWGELLRTGSGALHAPWIVLSVVIAMTTILVLLTLVGNALREAFDAKTAIRYK
jgi:microcin C transport system permease protein